MPVQNNTSTRENKEIMNQPLLRPNTIPLCFHGQVSHHFQSAKGDVLLCMIPTVLFEILKNCLPKLLFCRRSCSVRNFDHKSYEKEAILLVHIVPIYAQSYLKILCRLKLWSYFTASALQKVAVLVYFRLCTNYCTVRPTH